MENSNKIRDPRDQRKRLTIIAQRNLCGKDSSAWVGKDGEVSVYRSTDCPRAEYWIHGLNSENYLEHMKYT